MTVEESNKKVYKAPALEKGLEILELLADKKHPLSMGEIATELGRSKSEIFRMLSVLEQKNYLKKLDGGEKFTVTNHLFDLGMKVPPTSTLIEFMFPIMHEIAAKTAQSCHICVRSQDHFVIIARVDSPSPIGLSVRVGFAMKLIEATSGKLILAWLDKSKQKQIIKQQIKFLEDKIGIPEFEKQLDKIKANGVILNKSTFIESLTDISVPIFLGSNKNKVIAVLTVPCCQNAHSLLSIDETVDLLKEKATFISEKSTLFGGI